MFWVSALLVGAMIAVWILEFSIYHFTTAWKRVFSTHDIDEPDVIPLFILDRTLSHDIFVFGLICGFGSLLATFTMPFLLFIAGRTSANSTAPISTESLSNMPNTLYNASLMNTPNTIFDDMAAKIEASEYSATYVMTTDGLDPSEAKIVKKGSKQRTDTELLSGDILSNYYLGDFFYLCFHAKSAKSYSYYQPATCYNTNLTKAATIEGNYSNLDIVSKPARTVAGIVASCFGFSKKEPAWESERCYSSDGVFLYSSSVYDLKNPKRTVMAAVSVQRDPILDSEFDLPAAPE
jgi:hypothetical protein